MASVVDKLRLKEAQDRRRKLTEAQKEEIRKRYAVGDIGTGKLAKIYGVSKSLVQSVTNPAIAEYKRNRFKEHWKEYSNREALTEAARNLRKYKKLLHDKGEL